MQVVALKNLRRFDRRGTLLSLALIALLLERRQGLMCALSLLRRSQQVEARHLTLSRFTHLSERCCRIVRRCWLPSGADSWVLHENLTNSNLAAIGLLSDPFLPVLSSCLDPVHLLRLGARWPDLRCVA